MKGTSPIHFESVQERTDLFLTLFPHRFDYIYAPYPAPGQTPDWRTESRHPLSDRLLQQGSHLYGVRFGAQTNYCLLDIDTGSPYHPNQDPLAIARISAALEPIGLVSYLACTSSYSGGLHLYFPFLQPQSSWELASAVGTTLENAGFALTAGQLELFPNPRPYLVENALSLFNAHRLPMQVGSYLLNEDFQPIWSNQHSFVQQWQLVQQRNQVQTKTIKHLLKQAKRKHYCISGKADKFINDLNAEIEPGWTGYGQTNHLLGRITMRAYIFHHVIVGGPPLEGDALVEEIVNIALALPGYAEWCRHQHELKQRAEEWARCIENSHYFHYGNQAGKYKTKSETSAIDPVVTTLPTWNQQQLETTRDRIRAAIADLLETNTLPAKATARFRALLQYGVGGGSLYRHRDLWHPHYLQTCIVSKEDMEKSKNPSSLLPVTGGDNPPSTVSGDRPPADSLSTGGNSLLTPDRCLLAAPATSSVQLPWTDCPTGLAIYHEAAPAVQSRSPQIKYQAQQQHHIERVQGYWHSGDPILRAEVVAWAQVHLGVLCCSELLPLSLALLPQPLHLSVQDVSHLLVAMLLYPVYGYACQVRQWAAQIKQDLGLTITADMSDVQIIQLLLSRFGT
jgi:hypothetical protein